MRSISNALLTAVTLTVAAAAQAQTATPSPYAGSEACGVCHEDTGKAFAKTPHHILDKDQRACESCHGPGAKHAESAAGRRHSKSGKARRAGFALWTGVCLACHLNQPAHAGRLQSSHAKDLLACTTCHTIHGCRP